MKYFAVWLSPADRDEQAPLYREAHISYLAALREKGIVFANGRLLGESSGLVIFRGHTLEEVKNAVEQDPYVLHQIRSYKLYEWDLTLTPAFFSPIDEITAADLRTRLDQQEPIVIVDVREDDEVAAGRIEGAIHIRLGDLQQRYREIPAADKLYFICRGGRRSLRACEFLQGKGYTGLVNVTGGMTQWNKR